MKRLFAVLFSLSLLFSASPALGAETSTFNDVPERSWYAPYVQLCAQKGLMRGTGGGAFSPQAEMTAAEVFTLAARLQGLLQGGDSRLPEALEETGRLSLTLPDGAVLGPESVSQWGYTKQSFFLTIPWQSYLDLGQPEEVTLTLDGRISWQGSRDVINPATFLFPDMGTEASEMARTYVYLETARSGGLPGDWYWAGYAALSSLPGWAALDFRGSLLEPAGRDLLPSCLALVVPEEELAPINQIPYLPDTADPDVLRFYEAGILSGTDDYGTFEGDRSLTRAECAAMLSRVLSPELRLSFTPRYDGLPYTLTPLPLEAGAWSVWPPPAWTEASDQLYRGLSGVGLWPDPIPLLMAESRDTGKRGLMNWAGGWVLPPEYDEIGLFLTDGLARVKRDGLYGYIDITGSLILPCQYERATEYHDGVLAVGDGETALATYDTQGVKLGELPADANYNSTVEGYIQYRENGLYGYLNADGTVAVKAAYTSVYPFSEGLAAVADGNGLKGYVNSSGNLVIPCQYGKAGRFTGGVAVVGAPSATPNPLHYEGRMGLIDTAGREVAPLSYGYIDPYFWEGRACYIQGDTMGWLSADGTETPDETAFIFPMGGWQEEDPGPGLTQWLHLTRPTAMTQCSPILNDQAIVELSGRYFVITLEEG